MEFSWNNDTIVITTLNNEELAVVKVAKNHSRRLF
jgi:hypothetical protein